MARLLLDENLPRQLAPLLVDHAVRTVTQMRWNGVRNGRLLTRAEAEFDVLITADHGMRFQQSMKGRDLALVVLHAPTHNVEDLVPLVPQILALIESIEAGDVVVIGEQAPPAE